MDFLKPGQAIQQQLCAILTLSEGEAYRDLAGLKRKTCQVWVPRYSRSNNGRQCAGGPVFAG